jgi:alpha-galactosidase/6-phospho-beta-glucosidase family protein
VVRSGCFDEECTDATENKNEVYCKMIQSRKTRGAEERYKEMRKMEKRIRRKKKKEYYDEQMKQVQKLHGQKESRRMYRLVNDIKKEFKIYMTVCGDKTGVILSEPSEVME